MIRRTASVMMAAMLMAALLAPAPARADGPADPIATSFSARVGAAPPGVRAQVIDGYLQLWLSVRPGERAVVLDQLGAPWLRFDPAGGVWENRSSLLWYLTQVPVEAVAPRDLTAATPPRWFRVAAGHAYRWPDGRIGAFAAQALRPDARVVGPWSIPIVVDGRRGVVGGTLVTGPGPSPVWFWPAAVLVLCVLAAWRIGSATLDRRLALGLCAGLLGALLVVAVTRLLHGRPEVSGGQIVEFAGALGGIATAAAWLLRGRFPAAVPFGVAAVGLWAGLTFLPVLTHPYALVLLPAWLSRGAAVLLLGGSLSLVPVAMRRPLVR